MVLLVSQSGIFFGVEARILTKETHEDLTLRHDQILNGVIGQKGLVSKVEELYKWLQQNHGRNSILSNIKDILISGGILAVLIGYILNK